MSNRKNIWFIHHYASPPSYNGMTRPFLFSKYLNRRGYKTRIYCSSYQHWTNKQFLDKNTLKKDVIEDGVHFTFVRTQAGIAGVKRLLNMISFYRNVKKIVNKEIKTKEAPWYSPWDNWFSSSKRKKSSIMVRKVWIWCLLCKKYVFMAGYKKLYFWQY